MLLKNIICKIEISLDKILTIVSWTEKTVIPAIMHKMASELFSLTTVNL